MLQPVYFIEYTTSDDTIKRTDSSIMLIVSIDHDNGYSNEVA
jgi:hypothetical protein